MHTATITTAPQPAFWFLGGRMTIHLAGSDADGRCSIVRQELPAGLATPLHAQPGDDETFLVLDGEIELWIEGEISRAASGDAVSIARGTRHAFRVVSDDGAHLLAFGTPAGHERFYQLGGDPVAAHPEPPAGPLDMDRMGAAAAAAGVELLGPPPFA